MPIQAIIFDLDGTAIPNDPHGHPSARLVAAVKAAQPHLVLTAATGRPITNAAYILTELGLTSPCVIAAGTQIVDPVSQKILWEALIPTAAIEKILELTRPFHHEIVIRNELIGEGMPASSRTIEGDVNVLYFDTVPEADAHAIGELLKTVPGIIVSMVTSWGGIGLDIHVTPANGTKEHAVGEVLRMLEISKTDTIGVGDANNDVHLFNAVGHRVAMGNATDHLKALADEVIAPVSEDGLAQFIEIQLETLPK